ncbi:MAG: M20/M25/M40 family metallo-hydrolase [Myxococcales bacterium]|nr:M20/M25/M40 family metallo-hydrolase [Myxococcales bacterium]
MSRRARSPVAGRPRLAAARGAGAALAVAGLLAAGCKARDERPPPPPVGARADAAPDAGAAGTAVDLDREHHEGLWFPSPRTIGAHVAALADPALRGRGGGTADEAAAADRVAAWLAAAGVEPAGDDGGWLQPFTFAGAGTRRSQNVVGIVRGSDPRAPHVVVGAHYDHLGVIGGRVHPGADDNASGTAALVAIGAALARDGQRPRRTVVLVAFGAEEDGLHGSAHYADHPRRPLAEAALMINLDMVGRARFLSAQPYALAQTVVPPDAIGALTSPGADDVTALARDAAAREGRPLVATSDFGPLEALIRPVVEHRGDHKSFADRGVRYLWLSTSMHDDYHLPTDTTDKVDPVTVATVGRIVVRVIHGL